MTSTNEIWDGMFLKETLKLAKKGMSWTFPNPLVGAIIVKKGKICAKGYHRKLGHPHAEIEAIKSAAKSVQGATLYVNLEPCVHEGRTSPCVDAVIKSGISRVVCAVSDPNPQVSGKGIEQLRKAGIAVSVGICKDEARLLNEAFFTFHEKRRPFIAIKFASSLDGKIATKTGDSKWITNEKARLFARKLRRQYQAILVGVHTVVTDNPHLGTRIIGMRDPLRIILDPNLKTPFHSQVLRDNNVLLVVSENASQKKMKLLEQKGIQILTFTDSKIPVRELLSVLRKKEIISVLVEGGGETLGAFVDAGFVDRVYAFYAPIIIGGENAVSTIRGEGAHIIQDALQLKQCKMKRFENDYLITGICEPPESRTQNLLLKRELLYQLS